MSELTNYTSIPFGIFPLHSVYSPEFLPCEWLTHYQDDCEEGCDNNVSCKECADKAIKKGVERIIGKQEVN